MFSMYTWACEYCCKMWTYPSWPSFAVVPESMNCFIIVFKECTLYCNIVKVISFVECFFFTVMPKKWLNMQYFVILWPNQWSCNRVYRAATVFIYFFMIILPIRSETVQYIKWKYITVYCTDESWAFRPHRCEASSSSTYEDDSKGSAVA